MTEQEQIKEIEEIINKRCEAELGQVHANSKDGKVTKTVDTSLIAKDIINAGYRQEKEVARETALKIIKKIEEHVQRELESAKLPLYNPSDEIFYNGIRNGLILATEALIDIELEYEIN